MQRRAAHPALTFRWMCVAHGHLLRHVLLLTPAYLPHPLLLRALDARRHSRTKLPSHRLAGSESIPWATLLETRSQSPDPSHQTVPQLSAETGHVLQAQEAAVSSATLQNPSS